MKAKLLFKFIIVLILSSIIFYGCGSGGEKTDASSEKETAKSEKETPKSEKQIHSLSSKEKKLYNQVVAIYEKSDKLTEQWTQKAMKVSSAEEAIEAIKNFREMQKNMETEFSQIIDFPENSELEIESEDEDTPLSIAIQQYMQAKSSNTEYMQRFSKTMKVYMGLLTKYQDNPEIQKLMEEINQEED